MPEAPQVPKEKSLLENPVVGTENARMAPSRQEMIACSRVRQKVACWVPFTRKIRQQLL